MPHVHKFGGAALATTASIRRVIELISTATTGKRVIVVSALAHVTDALMQAALNAATGKRAQVREDVHALRARHEELTAHLLTAEPGRQNTVRAIAASFDELEKLLANVAEGRRLEPETTDAIVAHGERLSARIVTEALTQSGMPAQLIDATDVMHTDGRFGSAAPDIARIEVAARKHIVPVLTRDVIAVVPGFIGSGANGAVVTLGRGGSDLSATALGRALNASGVTLWKDVPGFLTADPRVVPEARVLPRLDAREASELSYYGAKVLHPRALVPLEPGTVLHIRPFADVAAPGTDIVLRGTRGGSPVSALSAIADQALFTIAGAGMLGVPGVAARAFSALARSGVSVSIISQASSEQSICFTVPDARAVGTEAALREEFAEELSRGEIADIDVLPHMATIAVVGSGMARTPGIAARVFGAVAEVRANVVAIAQGSSERNISLVVDGARAADAIRSIHRAFRLDKIGGGRAGRATGVDVVLIGCGRIGRELLQQIRGLGRRGGETLRIVAIIDRGGFVFAPRGLSARRLTEIVARKERGESVVDAGAGPPTSAEAAIAHIASHALTRPVVVDVSNGDTRAALLCAAEHGMNLVLANKIPLASDRVSALALLGDARLRGQRVLHEATVGAGLPIIDTIDKLAASGDRILSVSGCPSGTMGYLFGELGRGKKFSDALRAAMRLGYTEPDPREDLSGADVARKALILARLIGYTGEPADVAVESLIPESLRDVPLAAFLEQLESLDEQWHARVEEARARGEVLRYRVHVTRREARVGLVSVPRESSLATLAGTDNQFTFVTARYRENPLVITGPGAGAAVTAGGVLSDLLRIATP